MVLVLRMSSNGFVVLMSRLPRVSRRAAPDHYFISVVLVSFIELDILRFSY